jgi:hypothetical protein
MNRAETTVGVINVTAGQGHPMLDCRNNKEI